jgi:hypothetical protein
VSGVTSKGDVEAKGSKRSREGATLKSQSELKIKNVNPPRGA